MKRSFFAVAALCLAAAVHVAELAFVTCRALKNLAVDGVALLARAPEPAKEPFVVLVKAKAFVTRLVKRERPVLTNSWRMCPST